MKRQRAYLLPDVLCPAETLDICVSVPNNLGHLLAFLAQIEHLANWYAWEQNEARDNDTVAACWRTVFDDIRAKIDAHIGCGDVAGVQDLRLVDCILEKQDSEGNWTTVGSIADCVIAGINTALSDGTIPPSPYPVYPEPTTNPTNPTELDVACGIADFTSNYLIEKFNDILDLIEAAVGAGVTIAKIAADVVDAVAGFAPIVGGVIAAVKDVIEGSIAVTFAIIHASDTVDWRSDVKCALYNRLHDNGATFGTELSPVVTGWISDVKAMSPAISPLFGRWLESLDIRAFQKWQKISEDNEGECDDCEITWCYKFDFEVDSYGFTVDTYGAYSPGVGWIATAAGGGKAIILDKTFSPTINLKSIKVHLESTVPSGGNFYAGATGAVTITLWPDQPPYTGDYAYTAGLSDVSSIRIFPSANGAPAITIKSMTLVGFGDNPFGADNCG